MRSTLLLILALALDPVRQQSLEESVVGRWEGFREKEPIEFEVFKNRTAQVWREGVAIKARLYWVDATHVLVIPPEGEPQETAVEIKDGALILTDKRGRSLKFKRPLDTESAPPKIATPREFFDHRKSALEKKDYLAAWLGCSKRYREKMAEFAAQICPSPSDLRDMGFARSLEAIAPKELGYKFNELIQGPLAGEWSLADAQDEGDKATLHVRIRAKQGSFDRKLALIKENGAWVEDWSPELEAGMKRGILNATKTRCINNLNQLWKMENNYMVQFGGRTKSMPHETGGDFWLALSLTTPPLIDATLGGIYACPFKKSAHKVGTTDYRGPASDINKLSKDDAIIGACLGNHPDGSGAILLHDGEVKSVDKDDPLYKRALEETKP